VIATFLFAGEPLLFDDELRPRFTQHQVSGSAESIRVGLAKWATTAEGRKLIARFRTVEYEVTVTEDREDVAPGRAPQPGIATFITAGDPTKVKHYSLILNPALAAQYSRADAIDLGEPKTPGDVMAAAWAGEMLHIDFYADGIPLPHHNRPEFQERWRAVASELGFARMRHDTEEP
jgi:hypothetical protein